jgi:hypothetical protein
LQAASPDARSAQTLLRAFSGLFSAPDGQPQVPRRVWRHHLGEVTHDPVDIRRRIDRLVARVDQDGGDAITRIS